MVMLVYADDVAEEAQTVKKALRAKDIVVLDLRDHDDLLAQAEDACVDRWMGEVDFILPIVSRDYLRALQPPLAGTVGPLTAQVIRYIHSSMQNEVFAVGSNRRVRALLAKELVKFAGKIPELRKPLYVSWKSTGLTTEMGEMILKTMARRRVMGERCG